MANTRRRGRRDPPNAAAAGSGSNAASSPAAVDVAPPSRPKRKSSVNNERATKRSKPSSNDPKNSPNKDKKDKKDPNVVHYAQAKSSLYSTLLHELHTLSKSKPSCTAALQDISELQSSHFTPVYPTVTVAAASGGAGGVTNAKSAATATAGSNSPKKTRKKKGGAATVTQPPTGTNVMMDGIIARMYTVTSTPAASGAKATTTTATVGGDLSTTGGNGNEILNVLYLQHDNPNVHLILYATHVLNKLITFLQQQRMASSSSDGEGNAKKDDPEAKEAPADGTMDAAIVMAGIAFHLVKVLLHDRTKLERVINQSPHHPPPPPITPTSSTTSNITAGSNLPGGANTSSSALSPNSTAASAASGGKKKTSAGSANSTTATNAIADNGIVRGGMDARSILGKAIVSITCAATLSMEQLGQTSVVWLEQELEKVTQAMEEDMDTTTGSGRKKSRRSSRGGGTTTTNSADVAKQQKQKQIEECIRKAMWSTLFTLEMVTSFSMMKQPPINNNPITITTKSTSSTTASGTANSGSGANTTSTAATSTSTYKIRPSATSSLMNRTTIVGSTASMHVHTLPTSDKNARTNAWNKHALRPLYRDVELVFETGGTTSSTKANTNKAGGGGGMSDEAINFLASVCDSMSVQMEEVKPEDHRKEQQQQQQQQKGKKGRVAPKEEILAPSIHQELDAIVMDGVRVSIRRWAGMIFVWMCKGQLKGMKIAQNLLSEDSLTSWDNIMAVGNGGAIPGNVALVTFAARLMNVLSDSGKVCGVRAPSGGMEKYASLLLCPPFLQIVLPTPESASVVNPTKTSLDEEMKAVEEEQDNDDVPAVSTNTPRLRRSKRKSRKSTTEAASTSSTGSNNETKTTGATAASDRGDNVSADATFKSRSFVFQPNQTIRTWCRPDVRNEAVVTMYLLLSAHGRCLKNNVASPALLVPHKENLDHTNLDNPLDIDDGRTLHILLNEDNDLSSYNPFERWYFTAEEEEAMDKEVTKLYPFMHKTVDLITRIASNSISDPFDSNTSATILTIGSAMALKFGNAVVRQSEAKFDTHYAQTVVVADAKLSSMAVNRLSDCVGKIIESCDNSMYQCDSGKNKLPNTVIKDFNLQKPLLPKVSDRDNSEETTTSPSQSSICNFAGIVETSSSKVEMLEEDDDENENESETYMDIREDEEFRRGKDQNGLSLSFFLRAMLPDEEVSNCPKILMETILRIISCCYSSSGVLGKTSRFRTTFAKCALAADCLEALCQCLCFHGAQSSRPSTAIILRASLRRCCLSSDILCFCLGLAQTLERLLIQPRLDLENSEDLMTICDTKSRTVITSQRCDFDQWERRLWTAHVKLCLTIGRGNAVYKRFFGHKSFIGSTADKIVILKSIISAYSCDEEHDWPLYLSSIHHSMISTFLASDPMPSNNAEAGPERLICLSFIDSISKYLGNFKEIKEKIKVPFASTTENCRIHMSDELIPLSLRDARLFVMALCRLPKDEQKEMLANMVKLLQTKLSTILSDDKIQGTYTSHKGASSFLARVITLLSSAIDAVAVGKSYLDHLCQEVGEARYYLPSFIDMTERHVGFEMIDSSWYKKETYYTGVLPAWESNAPSNALSSETVEPLSAKDLSLYSELLRDALHLGFGSAPIDNCHLIFAAWSASGKLPGWEKSKWNEPMTATEFTNCRQGQKLMRLREDICQIHCEFDEEEKSTPNSLLTKILKEKKRKTGTNTMPYITRIKHITSGLSESLGMIDSISFDVHTKKCNSKGDFVVMEATIAYVSFLISMCTKSDRDYVSTMLRRLKTRKRKGSSISADSLEEGFMEDESDDSDSGCHDDYEDDDDTEAKLDGISRLHDICSTIGAAPIHPDWLDTSCQIRSALSRTKVVELAVNTLDTLTNFGILSYAKYSSALERVLQCKEAKEDSEQTPNETTSLPLILIACLEDTKNSNTKDASLILEALAGMCSLDQDDIHAILDDSSCKNINTVKEAYIPNSSQRIRGKLQECGSLADGLPSTLSDYRAAGEWELLFAESFLGACADIESSRSTIIRPIDQSEDSGPESSVSDTSQNRSVISKEMLKELANWRRVLHNTLNTLVSVTALLRLAVSYGKGRKPHHLIVVDPSTEKSKDPAPTVNVDCTYGHELDSTVSKAVTFLSEIQSCGYVMKDTRKSAHAAASHLVWNESDLRILVDISSTKNTLLALSGLAKNTDIKITDTTNNCIKLAEKVIDVIGQNFDKEKDENGQDGSVMSLEKSILSCLGFAHSKVPVCTIVKSYPDVRSLLSPTFEDQTLPITWRWNSLQDDIINLLITMLSQSQSPIELKSKGRSVISSVLSSLLNVEEELIRNDRMSTDGPSKTLVAFMNQWWNALSPDLVQDLIENDLCMIKSSSEVNDNDMSHLYGVSRDLSSIVLLLLGSNSPSTEVSSNKNWEIALISIRDNLKKWMSDLKLNHVLWSLCALAIRFDELKGVGVVLLSLSTIPAGEPNISTTNYRALFMMERFYHYLCDVQKQLRGEDEMQITETSDGKNEASQNQGNALEIDTSALSSGMTKNGPIKLRNCTFVNTKGDFSMQHWYNCYTCGLVWDQGCCSLCAQVCHKGHDVGYSRKSSFFCDCGAEVTSGNGRPSCQCLAPLSDDTLVKLNGGGSDGKKNEDSSKSASSDRDFYQKNLDKFLRKQALNIAVQRIPEFTLKSLESFAEEAKKSGLFQNVFEQFSIALNIWKSKEASSSPHNLRGTSLSEGRPIVRRLGFDSPPQLGIRSGKPLEISHLEERTFSAIHAAKAHCFNTRISSETSTDRMRKAMKNDMSRNVIVADFRGRMIIAEQESLLFCAALPLVNVRYLPKPIESHLERNQMYILGSEKVKFNIIGTSLCKERNTHLVVWGISEVSIFLVGQSYDMVEARIDLAVGLDCENDHVLKAEWMPSSSGNILVVFGATFMKIYDIRSSTSSSESTKDKCYSCSAAMRYTLAYEEVAIRSGTIVPSRDSNRRNNTTEDMSVSSKIVLLFDTGRIHLLDLNLDSSGNLGDQGESFIDCADGISFPTAGIRRCSGACAEPKNSTSTSFGEGSSLTYMSQSGILLYKCVSSSLVAFTFDEDNKISGSFEFLPHILSPKMIGKGDDDHSVSGPFTHWTELGVVKRGNSLYYRASFVGRSTKNNQPKLLVVEFNDFDVKVTEVNWPTQRHNGLGLSTSTSFDGVVAFSGPYSSGEYNESIKFIERTYIAIITSNGSLLIYGGDIPASHTSINISEKIHSSPSKRRRAISDSSLTLAHEQNSSTLQQLIKTETNTPRTQPKFPLTIFESLINVSDRKELVFGGDAVESKPDIAKRKLSINSSEFIISPSRERCTLTVRLASNVEEKKKNTAKGVKVKNVDEKRNNVKPVSPKLAIVAVRILVGSTTKDLIPREIVVMGRPIPLTENMKRWYDVPLTDEEILLGVRNGLVCIGFGASFDSSKNPPLLDAVEVYAQEREKMPHLFPSKDELSQELASSSEKIDENESLTTTEAETIRNSLNKSILVVTNVCHILGNDVKYHTPENMKTLQRVIQVTALDCSGQGDVRDHVIDLLKVVEQDEHARQLLIDEGTMLGIFKFLSEIGSIGMDEFNGSDHNNLMDTSESVLKKESGAKLNELKWNICSVLDDCIVSALSIIKERPANYRDCTERLISAGSITSSVALCSKRVLDLLEDQFVTETVSKLVELATLEIVINDSPISDSFANVRMVSDLLKRKDESVVKYCCSTLVNLLSKVPFQLIESIDTDQNGPASAYQCDGCEAFPITGTRYTLEEGHDIDLCKTCYKSGFKFAEANQFQSTKPVSINGKRLHLASGDMSCSQIQQMRPVAVPSMIVEQVRQATAAAPEPMEEFFDEDKAALQMALDMSLESQNEGSYNRSPNIFTIRQRIFDQLLEDVVAYLLTEDSGAACHTIPLIDLLLSFIFQSNQGEDQSILWKKIIEVLVKTMSTLTESCRQNQNSAVIIQKKRQSLVICLRTLTCLLIKKGLASTESWGKVENKVTPEVEEEPPGEKSREKTDPNFFCAVHKVPAVRRRCSHGEHKDRRFYVCGMDRKQRCDYFKWASDKSPTVKSDQGNRQEKLSVSINKPFEPSSEIDFFPGIQSELWKLFSTGSPPLQIQLCYLLQTYVKNIDSKGVKDSSIDGCQEGTKPEIDNFLSTLLSDSHTNDQYNVDEEMEDGLLLSARKLGPFSNGRLPSISNRYETELSHSRSQAFSTSEFAIMEASIDLFALVAMNALNPSTTIESAWEGWCALLCRITSITKLANLRHQARKMLKRLCGGRAALYHQVKDHYEFSFKFMSLIGYCESPMQEALKVREKARRCGLKWGNSNVTWETLPAGGLIGVEDLISEDSHVISNMAIVGKLLDELIISTKSRSKNWRQFCGLKELPLKISGSDIIDTTKRNHLQGDKNIRDRSPICLLLWMACSLPSTNQVKVFKLMDLALGSHQEKVPEVNDDLSVVVSTDGATDLESHGHYNTLSENQEETELPENALLVGAGGLSVDDLYAFIVHFVLNGQDSELRSVAKSISQKLIVNATSSHVNSLIHRLVFVCLRNVGPLGSDSLEFLQLLNTFVTDQRIEKTKDLMLLSEVLIKCFTEQMAILHDMSSSLIVVDPATMDNKNDNDAHSWPQKTFDLASCTHCHRKQCGKIGEQYQASPKPSEVSKTSSSAKTADSDGQDSPQQMKSFKKLRIDSTFNTVSAEFSTHVQLKSRMLISEVSSSVSDPRGRYAKSIGVFFTPRHVRDVNELKSDEYKPLWQRIGTLSLSRGASRASCKLAYPVAAANLKFEYEEFYEKISGARSSDGSLILHCPRCTRIVNNSHGVCGHCGEVAYQCRKCRHINYDRLDAFLCVECGYCASGGFSYELTVGVASKAVAIVCDEDLEMSVRLLRQCSKKLGELKALLKRRLQGNDTSKKAKKSPEDIDDFGGLSNYSSSLKRALAGELPKISSKASEKSSRREKGKRRSIGESSITRPDPAQRSSRANKARSLLSLARQIRSESGGRGDRTSRGDLLVQQAILNSTAGSTFEMLDEADSDMLGIINSSAERSIFSRDMPDPLSRLVANIQARARDHGNSQRNADRSEGEDDQQRGSDRSESGKKGKSNSKDDGDISKKSAEECQNLHQQMREMERDCYDLRRRIIAWKRLNRDALADFGTYCTRPEQDYVPVLSNSCAPTVMGHFLVIIMALFGAQIDGTEKTLNKEFVNLLFEEPADMNNELLEMKRAVIVTIAISSDRGSEMVLTELKGRLKGGTDIVSAEILGKILENDFHLASTFEALALETLENSD